MDNIEEVEKFVQALDITVDNLEEKLTPFLQKNLDELVSTYAKNQNSIQVIKIYNNYLYTLISVLFAYLRTIGINTAQHPIMKELARIKSYINRSKELQKNTASKQKSDEILASKAKEFLQNTLGMKSSIGGAALTENLSTPAISSSNFKGTHTKFDDDADSDNEITKSTTPIPTSITSKTSKVKSKVSKPKKNKKS